MVAIIIENVPKQMISFEEIPNLTSISRVLNVRNGSNTTYQSPQIPDINSASPGHLKYDLWSSIDIRLYERAGLMCFPNSCLPKITKNR